MFSLKPLTNPTKRIHNIDTNSTTLLKSLLTSLITKKPFSVLAQQQPLTNPEPKKPNKDEENTQTKLKHKPKNKRPLDVLFKEALGLTKMRENGVGVESFECGDVESSDLEDMQLRKRLWELEMELRKLQSKEKVEEKVVEEKCEKRKGKSLHELFGGKKGEVNEKRDGSLVVERKRDKVVFLKEISKDVEMLIRRLYDDGYFKKANFMPRKGNGEVPEFDLKVFDCEYARDFVKFASEKFGKDHQKVAMWLSGSDLKKLALFGCPSSRKREVFAAKRLRYNFNIPEETVCSNCSLKKSCKYVNQSVWKGEMEEVRVDLVIRLLLAYSLEDTPPELKVTDELKACVHRLMNDVINLSKTAA